MAYRRFRHSVETEVTATSKQQTGTSVPNGLSEAEAERRLDELGRPQRAPTSRSYVSIVRANVLTLFNAILLAFGVLTLAFGDWRDALFLGIVVANSAIGIVQEVRAKRALDRLAVLVAPHARVFRDGIARSVAIEQLVPGDVVALEAGDQVPADGRVVGSVGLYLDESILTGESQPVRRDEGASIRSGAFVLEGAATLAVEAVGDASYAQRLAGEARTFRHPRSPLERAINRLLLALTIAVFVLGTILGYSLLQRNPSTREAVATATAGVVSLIPEGLMLLTSLVFAVGAVRMAHRGALAQQLNAIESLASADVICLDKTGTLTEEGLRVVAVVARNGVAQHDAEAALARYVSAAQTSNRTLAAIAARFSGADAAATMEVPFSSRRRWSALAFGGTTYVLGAPELFDLGELQQVRDDEVDRGRRVVALGTLEVALGGTEGEPALPQSPRALCLVVLAEALRDQARATVEFFRGEGVELKVLSGDAPDTVAAIARDAGIAVDEALDGSDLPTSDAELLELAQRATVIGRISPEGKRRVVEALRDAGRYVAMVGDGVNDVPALKASRLAIAQGGGSDIAKSVADVVLVGGDFAAVPAMVAEGRQALRNLARVARLYVTKSAFAAFLILTIGTTDTAYPLLPRHFSLVAALTVGIPTFLLALAPSSGRWQLGQFGREVAHFAVPAGVLAGVGVVASYLFALNALDLEVAEARTIATSVLLVAGLYLVLVLEGVSGTRGKLVSAGCVVLAALYVTVLLVPGLRGFFDLVGPTLAIVVGVVAGAGIALVALWLGGFSPQRSTEHG